MTAVPTRLPPHAPPLRPTPLRSHARPSTNSLPFTQVHPSFHHVYVPPWAVPAAPQQQTVRAFREEGTQTGTGAIEARPLASHTAEDVADHYEARAATQLGAGEWLAWEGHNGALRKGRPRATPRCAKAARLPRHQLGSCYACLPPAVQAFMQHFIASLPHLAMALADMHLNLGGGSPLFVKSQVGAAGGTRAEHVGGRCQEGRRLRNVVFLAPAHRSQPCLPPHTPPCTPQYFFNTLLQLKDEMGQLGERLQPAGQGSQAQGR